MQKPRELTVGAAINLMRRGELTAKALVTSCLERIHERDATIHAWVEVDGRRIETSRPIGSRGFMGIIPANIRPIITIKF